MVNKGRFFFLYFILFFAAQYSAAQDSYEGKEFLVTYISSNVFTSSGNFELEVIVSTRKKNVNVVIQNTVTMVTYTLTGLSDTSVTVKIANSTTSNSCVPIADETPGYFALKVTATDDIIVYAMAALSSSADGTLVLPNNALGTHYFLPIYSGFKTNPSTGIIVATEDNTQIEITPAIETSTGRPAGVPFTITLDKEQTYKIAGKQIIDFSGTEVRSLNKKKFGLFVGVDCINIPSNFASCDLIYEQVPPVSAWGKKFLVAQQSTPTVTPKYGIRVLASRDSTVVTIDGTYITTLDRGKYYTDLNFTSPVYIETSKPSCVTQLTLGATLVNIGDPSIVIIPPLEQMATDVIFNTATYQSFRQHYVCLIVPSAGTGKVKLNDTLLNSSIFTPFPGNSAYSYASIGRKKGLHKVFSPTGCIGITYGYGSAISYSSIGSSVLRNLAHSIDVKGLECGSLDFEMNSIGDTDLVVSSYWDFGDGTNATGLKANKTYAAHGTYTVLNVLHTTGVNPGIDTIKKILKTKPQPEARFGFQQSQCLPGNRVTLYDSSDWKGATKASRRWFFSDIPLVYTNKDSIFRSYNKPNHTSDTTYPLKIWLEVTTEDGCIDTAQFDAKIYPPAIADFEVQGERCFAENSFRPVQKSTINLDSISGYLWNFGDGTTDTAASPVKKFNDTGTFTIRMIARAATGCHDTAWSTFTVFPSPVASFTVAPACYGDKTVIVNQSTILSGALKYKWNFGDGFTDTLQQVSHLYADTSAYKVKLIAYSNNQCTDTIEKTVFVMAKPNAAFSFVKNCQNNPVLFTDNTNTHGIPMQPNLWYFGDGNMQQVAGNASHTYTVKGLYTTKLVARAANGCADSVSRLFYINPMPSAAFTYNDGEQCLKGNNFIFTNTTSLSEGSIKTYNWFVDGSAITSTTNYSRSFINPAQYLIKLKAETDSGCFDSITKVITVFPQIKVDISINDTAQCYKWHQFLVTNNSVVNGSGNIAKYNWLYSDGSGSTNAAPTPKRFASEGKYWVQCVMETDNGCTDSFYKDITVYFSPSPAFTANDICLGDLVHFDNTTVDTNDKITRWDWNFGNGTKSKQKNPYYKYPAPGNYNVSLTATTTDGCSDTLTVYFPNLVYPVPHAYFEEELIGNYERFTTYQFTNGSAGANKYLWDFGDGTIGNNEHPEKIYEGIGQFMVKLTAENQWGCVAYYQRKLIVVPEIDIQIPNAFTPGNGDDLNRVFRVEGVFFTKEFSMDIFNRWGEKVFHTTEAGHGWDGTFAGNATLDGMYMYVIRIMDLKNKVHIYYGSFMLLR